MDDCLLILTVYIMDPTLWVHDAFLLFKIIKNDLLQTTERSNGMAERLLNLRFEHGRPKRNQRNE